jgi:hypothetical protein
MKTIRIFSIVMAVVLLVVAVIPVAGVAAAMRSNIVSSPTRAFADAAQGWPLLAPMSLSLPLVSLSMDTAASSPNDYLCTFISQTPPDWKRMKPRQDFDMKWTVQNSGNRLWHASSIALVYVGGQKMQTRGNKASLSADVARGAKTTIAVDMNAPKTPGTYSALWSLVSGKKNFCRLTITLTVTR